MSLIKNALEKLDYPVCHAAYRGKERKFLLYEFLGQDVQVFAESREAETSVSWSLDLYTDQVPLTQDLDKIKSLLEGNNIRCRVDAVTHDQNLDLQHAALTAWSVGRVFD